MLMDFCQWNSANIADVRCLTCLLRWIVFFVQRYVYLLLHFASSHFVIMQQLDGVLDSQQVVTFQALMVMMVQ